MLYVTHTILAVRRCVAILSRTSCRRKYCDYGKEAMNAMNAK